MLHVSIESDLASEIRLRDVFRRSRIEKYDAPYSFLESDSQTPSNNIAQSAIALIRDGASISQLQPAVHDDVEQFALWSVHFPAEVDNSGFVGWLARKLKRKFGAGVFIVCGSNSSCGGIYDYWGAPEQLRAEVFAELDRLKGLAPKTPTDELSLDDVVMRTIETSEAGSLSADTLFLFEQSGAIVRGRYEGGPIVAGTLVGELTGGFLEFTFSQIERGGEMVNGKSTCLVSRKDHLLTLKESFTWYESNRPPGVNLMQEIPLGAETS